MDLQLFQFINNLAGRFFWLDQVGIFFASNAGYALLAVLASFFIVKKQYRMVIVSVVSALIARGFLVELIRFFYQRPRPVPVDALHQLVVNDHWAFPSGHASFFFALSTGVYLYNKKLGLIFYAISLLMGIARIFIGVHWPSDIIGGAALGIATALIINRLCAFLNFARTYFSKK